MNKSNLILDLKLDSEEQAVLASFETGDMNNSSLSKKSLERFKLVATETIINERLFEKPSNLARNTG